VIGTYPAPAVDEIEVFVTLGLSIRTTTCFDTTLDAHINIITAHPRYLERNCMVQLCTEGGGEGGEEGEGALWLRFWTALTRPPPHICYAMA